MSQHGRVPKYTPAARFHLVVLLAASAVLASCRDEPTTTMVSPSSPDSALARVDLIGGASTSGVTLGAALPGLTTGELARFEAGRDEFIETEEPDEGLGPVFNEASCAACHDNPVGGTNGRLETRFGRVSRGVFDPLASLGGSLLQDHGIGAVTVGGDYIYQAESVPPSANVVAGRVTTPLFGLGLVDAVPDRTFRDLARLEAITSPGTAGRVSLATEIRTGQTRVGRFGWKAGVPTLFQFSGDAYLNEMGITSPEFPNENCPQGDCTSLSHNPMPTLNDAGDGVEKFFDFMTMLAPPARGPITSQVLQGGIVFATIGCASCHTPVLFTGPSPIQALSNRAFEPYSDFLLHDMGSLGDGIVQGDAKAREMRTAPLWGLRTRTAFLLHDGRANSIEAAITAHDGQGRGARNRFGNLNTRSRSALLAFLNSL